MTTLESEGIRKRNPDALTPEDVALAVNAYTDGGFNSSSSNLNSTNSHYYPNQQQYALLNNNQSNNQMNMKGVVVDTPAPATATARPRSTTSSRRSNNPKSSSARRILIRAFIVGTLITVVLVAIVVGFYFSWLTGPAAVTQVDYTYLNTTKNETRDCLLGSRNSTGYDAKVFFYYTFGNVDLITFSLASRWTVIVCGSRLVDTKGFLLHPIEIYVDQEKFPMDAGLATKSGEMDWGLTGGPLYKFPFDSWNVNIISNAIIRNSTTLYLDLPVGVIVNPISSSYEISPTLLPPGILTTGFLSGAIVAPTTVSRTSTSIALVIFIAIAMWTLSLSMLITALDAAFVRPHRIEADVVGASIALLFALPQLRDGMPEVPPIGYAQVDVFAYSVCLLISAIAAIILLWDFLLKTKVAEDYEEVPEMVREGERVIVARYETAGLHG